MAPPHVVDKQQVAHVITLRGRLDHGWCMGSLEASINGAGNPQQICRTNIELVPVLQLPQGGWHSHGVSSSSCHRAAGRRSKGSSGLHKGSKEVTATARRASINHEDQKVDKV